MRKEILAIVEELNSSKNESVNEGWGSECLCPSNIDPKKYDSLVKKCKGAGYKITGFEIYKLNKHVSKRIDIDLINPNTNALYVRYIDGKFYTYPRVSADFDDAGIKQLIQLLTEANDLCNFLNKENFESYMIADHP